MFDFFNQVIAFFDEISGFINTGIYSFFTDVFAQLVIYLTIAGIKFKTMMLTFAWGTAKQVITQLNISLLIQNTFSVLDSKVLNFIAFFRLPECINIITSAYVTRYVLSIIGM